MSTLRLSSGRECRGERIVPLESQSNRVLLVDALDSRASLLLGALNSNGYAIIQVLSDVERIGAAVEELRPDILVVGIGFPYEKTFQQLAEIREKMPLPVIVFSEKDSPALVQKVVETGVSAFVVDDIRAQRVPSIINIAMARFHNQQSLLSELKHAKHKLAERKVLEKAKGLLMKQKGLSEDEAYVALRKTAMDNGQTIAIVAQSIIDVFSLLEG